MKSSGPIKKPAPEDNQAVSGHPQLLESGHELANELNSNQLTQIIEQAKQEWEATVDSLPQLIFLFDRHMQIIRANRTIEAWGLAQVTAVKGTGIHHLLHPTCTTACYLRTLLEQAQTALDQAQSLEYEAKDTFLQRHLQLQIRPISTYTAESKNTASSFGTLVISDISKRKQMEEELQKSYEVLEQRVKERTAELFTANDTLRAEIVERERIEKALRESERRYRQRAAELHALHEVSLRLNAQLETRELLNLIAEQVVALLGAETGGLFIYDTFYDQLQLSFAVGYLNDYVGTTLKPGEGLIGQVFKTQQTTISENELNQVDDASAALPTQAGLAVPLVGADGALGVLSVGSQRKQPYNEYDLWLAELFAAQTVVALENARLHTETQNHARKWAALNKASRTVASSLDLNSVLKQITVEIQTLLEAERASVLLTDGPDKDLIFAAVANADAEALLNTRLSLNEGIAGWVVREGKPALANDVQHDSRFFDGIDRITGRTTRSLLAVPLIVKEKVIGVVEVINRASGPFEANDLEILEALASSAAIAIENASLYEAEREQFRRLQQSQTQLIQVEKMAALGRLVGSMAHEINNPLQSVQGFLDLLGEELEGQQRPEKLTFYLGIAGTEIERISTIVRRMRDFYRPTTPQSQVSSNSLDDFYRSNQADLQSITLPSVLESVLQLANKKLQHNRITVDCLWADNLPQIQGNADYLKQVFLNLALNAIDAMAPEGGTLKIRMELDRAALYSRRPVDAVRIEFRDTGAGMSAEVLARLFEPLFTTKRHGSGFGLFTSYKIIEAHHGQITAASRIGQGTTFTILLPIEQL